MGELVVYPDPRLRVACERVFWPEHQAEMEGLVRNLKDVMDAHPDGLGLSAPQVGGRLRAIVVNRGAVSGVPVPELMVNPEILSARGRQREKEGCLSLPGLSWHVTRPAKVELAWETATGSRKSARLSGVWARLACHEIDHLDGVLVVDRLSRKGWKAARREIRRKPWWTGGEPGRRELR